MKIKPHLNSQKQIYCSISLDKNVCIMTEASYKYHYCKVKKSTVMRNLYTYLSI